MFEFFFSGMHAFQTLLMLFMGFAFLAIGKLLAGNFIYWRLKASRTKGRVVAMKEKPGSDNQTYYHPVTEFMGEDGELHRITSDIGRTHLHEKEIGRNVTILYFPNEEKKARVLGSGWPFFLIGLIFAASGGWLFYMGLQTLELGLPVAIVGTAILLYAGWNIQKAIKPREEWESLQDFKLRKEKERAEEQETYTELSAHEVQKRFQEQRKTFRYVSLGMLVGALAFAGASYYVGIGVWELEQTGLSAPGEVIDMDMRSDSDGTTYAPIVRYTTQDGTFITFTSSMSSNPPMYERGDQVDVLYDPENHESNVMIDAGWWNWLLPGVFGGFSLIFFLIALPGLFRNTQRL